MICWCLTGVAVALGIFDNIETTYFAIFDILAEKNFVVGLTVIYLGILVLVALSDMVALAYACKYRPGRRLQGRGGDPLTNSSLLSSSIKGHSSLGAKGVGGGGGGHLQENLLRVSSMEKKKEKASNPRLVTEYFGKNTSASFINKFNCIFSPKRKFCTEV